MKNIINNSVKICKDYISFCRYIFTESSIPVNITDNSPYLYNASYSMISLKDDTCLINGYCFNKDETSPFDYCKLCNISENRDRFSIRKGNLFFLKPF